jgi:hypothetical protein
MKDHRDYRQLANMLREQYPEVIAMTDIPHEAYMAAQAIDELMDYIDSIKTQPAKIERLQKPVACIIGARGSAFDSPETKRAYTYAQQPGNLIALALGVACLNATRKTAGDGIDRGLSLLQELQKEGFGVFDLGAEYTPPAQPAPVQEPLGFWQGEFKDGSAALYEVPQESLFGRKYPNIPVYTAAAQPAPVQEPVGYVYGNSYWEATNLRITDDVKRFGSPRYATPPAQPAAWVGLTADEMLEALVSVDPATKRLPIGFTRFAQAIEAKLREKNGGAV